VQADKGKSFEVKRDTIVVIRLKENPTTGYQWAVHKADDKVLSLQSSEFSLPEGPRIGQGGTRAFAFRAKATGTARIELKHWREWEGEESTSDRFAVTIVVKN